jgi:hypothetical protein
MICPLCAEETSFIWCVDFESNEWARCKLCDGLTDQAEIDAANHEDLPMLVPVSRKLHMPSVSEWESCPTRIDISAGCVHPGRPGSDWLRDLIDGVFEHANRIEIEAWSFSEEDAA